VTATPDDRAPRGGQDRPAGGLTRLLGRALAQFTELTNQEPERVSGVRASDSGWSVLADVLELERVPSTTSVLATYRLDIDTSGNLLGYERLRRFMRGATDA
jgi:Gas vesicle synthesis protein GvpO